MKIACACLLIAACDAGGPMPPPVSPAAQPDWPPPAMPSPPMTSAITVAGETYAVVRLQRDCGEATNLGGEHFTFDVDGAPGAELHGGGHGIYGDGNVLPGGIASQEVWVGRYYVAEVHLFARPAEIAGLDCTYHQMYEGTVGAVSPASDREDAWRQLAAISTTGFHPAVRIDRENYNERGKGVSLESALHGL